MGPLNRKLKYLTHTSRPRKNTSRYVEYAGRIQEIDVGRRAKVLATHDYINIYIYVQRNISIQFVDNIIIKLL